MKITNWLEAQQIIDSGESVLISVLKSYADEDGVYLGISHIELMVAGYIPFERKYIIDKFIPIVEEIAIDMKQAKEYLNFNTNVEDNILQLSNND